MSFTVAYFYIFIYPPEDKKKKKKVGASDASIALWTLTLHSFGEAEPASGEAVISPPFPGSRGGPVRGTSGRPRWRWRCLAGGPFFRGLGSLLGVYLNEGCFLFSFFFRYFPEISVFQVFFR